MAFSDPLILGFLSRLELDIPRVLMLDYDGTLAPFTENRDKAFPYPGVRETLDEIMETRATRLVIISGRAIGDLKPLLGLRYEPEIWGSHGLERLTEDGSYSRAVIDSKLLGAIDLAESRAKQYALADQCERKPAGMALHTRKMTASEAELLKESVLKEWSKLIMDKDLEVHEFDGGLEIRITGINKAKAVRTIVNESPEQTLFAYLGDDLTDEDAFKEIKGMGLSALVREQWRQTQADVWLRSHDQMLEFLREWLRIERSGGPK